MVKFNKLCYTGVPVKYRGFAYKVLLGIYTKDLYEINEIDSNNFIKYMQMLETKENIAEKNLFKSHTASYCKFPVSEKIIHQIYIDILRLNKEYRIVCGIDFSYIYMNILLINAVKRPAIEYIQGMSDLVIPFFIIFIKNEIEKYFSDVKHFDTVCEPDEDFVDVEKISRKQLLSWESSVFFCFDALMHKIGHNFVNMHDTLINRTKKELKKVDKEIFLYLKKIDLDLHFFVFRWFNCLFIREFEIEKWFNIFTSFLSSEKEEFLINFALALIVKCRKDILGKEFSEVISHMQNLSNKNIDVCEILGKAVYIKYEIEY